MKPRQYTIASNGKRDFHSLEVQFDHALEHLKTAETWRWEGNREKVIAYLQSCKLGMVKSGGKNKKIGKATLYRVMGILRLLSEVWIQKDFSQTTQDDWNGLYIRMEEGDIKNEYGKPFKQSTRAKNYKTIRKFLRYLKLDNLAETWDVTEEVPTKAFLTRTEVEKLQSGASIKTRAIITTLFDGGFRAEEFANLRWCDLNKKEEGYLQAHVRKETSKTKQERYVSLWLATDLLEAYKAQQMSSKGAAFREEDFLYEGDYQSLIKQLKRLGDKMLQKHVNPHMLRHSSATYYASIIKTYANFCARYGWTLRSSVPQRYWHSNDDGDVAVQTKDHELARFKTDFERVQLENKSLRERLERIEKMIVEFHQDTGPKLKHIQEHVKTLQKTEQ